MYLGIEIGGTKLQLGVGDGASDELAEVARHEIDARAGAQAILDQIQVSATELTKRHSIKRVGIGFGGPVDLAAGIVTKSHQVTGWDAFPLAAWCHEKIGLPAVIGNDCDVAALAEARFGAGQGLSSVFYVTVGTGIGGGLVLNGKLHGGGRPAAAEIGHLRPGLDAYNAKQTVEGIASGPAIAEAGKALLRGQPNRNDRDVVDLLRRCGDDPERLTTMMLAAAAASGNAIADDILRHACRALGWAIAQAITLIAPEIVVIGGGVSLMGDALFFAPLREEVAEYVFPPLQGSYRIVPAVLGELAVVHGAIALAADAGPRSSARS